MAWSRMRATLMTVVFGVLASGGVVHAEATVETAASARRQEESVAESQSHHQCYQHPLFRKRHSKKKRSGTAPVAAALPTPQLTSASR